MKGGLPSVGNSVFHIVMDVAKGADKEMTDLGHGLVHTAKATSN